MCIKKNMIQKLKPISIFFLGLSLSHAAYSASVNEIDNHSQKNTVAQPARLPNYQIATGYVTKMSISYGNEDTTLISTAIDMDTTGFESRCQSAAVHMFHEKANGAQGLIYQELLASLRSALENRLPVRLYNSNSTTCDDVVNQFAVEVCTNERCN